MAMLEPLAHTMGTLRRLLGKTLFPLAVGVAGCGSKSTSLTEQRDPGERSVDVVSGTSSGPAARPRDSTEQTPNSDRLDSEAPSTEGGAGTGSGIEGENATESIDPPRPQPPDGYGVLKLPVSALIPEALTLHAIAGYEIVAVYAKPSRESDKLGFIRLGTRLRAGTKIVGEDCRKGWYALEGGGFACASRGLQVDTRPPFMKSPPKAPRMDQPFPYDWAYVRKWNSPMWWRVPTANERVLAAEERAKLESERTGEPLPEKVDPQSLGTAPATSPEPPQLAKKLPGPPDAEPDPGRAASMAGEPVPTQEVPVPEVPPIKLPLSPAHPWLEKGFFLSIGETVKEDGRSYWRTARGGYVAKSNVYTYKTKDFSGAVLSDEMTFPVGFVIKKGGTKLYELDEQQKLKTLRTVDKRTFLDLTEEVEHRGKTYMVTAEGELVRKDHMRMPTATDAPEGIDPWERWIDVDLSTQLLVAYEGAHPVYTTLVSTGRKGTEEEPFETPTGRWRVYSKQVTSNMDGSTASDGNYAIQDVPWVMYFEGSYALHGAFWHRSFGHVRSHGCVNLGPSDARWLFNWTTPFLPEGWHGVNASEGNPGSTVVVRRSEAGR